MDTQEKELFKTIAEKIMGWPVWEMPEAVPYPDVEAGTALVLETVLNQAFILEYEKTDTISPDTGKPMYRAKFREWKPLETPTQWMQVVTAASAKGYQIRLDFIGGFAHILIITPSTLIGEEIHEDSGPISDVGTVLLNLLVEAFE